MALVTVSTRTEETGWSWPLRARILAVNLFAVLMLAGGILYLESYRERLIDVRRAQVRGQVQLIALALASDRPDQTRTDVLHFGRVTGGRIRLYGPAPKRPVVFDNWAVEGPNFQLRRVEEEPFRRRVALILDEVIDFLVDAPRIPDFPVDFPKAPSAWPSLGSVRPGVPVDRIWRAPDRTLIVTAAAEVPGRPLTVHMVINARDITFAVREERLRSFELFLGVLAATLGLSIFLARTIVSPLSELAEAAVRVREGREREVVVPRLPTRRDEIGQLARALSDMTAALRGRIDATEAFAADVAHELKNPMASMRSALETMERVEEPELRRSLMAVMADDVSRMDRLLSAIADASRLDAEISRARFVAVDLAAILTEVARYVGMGRDLTIRTPEQGPLVRGDPERLGQVVRNLLENAAGFSPPGGTVQVRLWPESLRMVSLTVEDEGPGIPPEQMERIFDRFYTARPDADGQGAHSGLGLAIARAIVEAHGGRIFAENRREGGARLTLSLPRA